MKTDILNPRDLFQNPIRYTIPAFQRRYVWKQDDQWEPLWDDVRNTADIYLEQSEQSGNDGSGILPHFLGGVVIQQVDDRVTDVKRREVIDGQQRMTTIQLLIDAVQYVFEEFDGPEMKRGASRLSKLVTNDEDFIGTDEDEVFKLWPTTGDREAFRRAMDNGLPTYAFEDSLIVQAHEFFQLQVKEWLGSDLESLPSRARALEATVTSLLQMVVIDLTPTDDPHIIFETLNARGTPLQESELIKNYVMFRVGQVTPGQDEIWGDLSGDWWREEIRQGRLIKPRIDVLLNYWLIMRTTTEVSANRVFREFKYHADDLSIEDLMSEVRRDLENYRRFYKTGPRTRGEETFHYRAIQVMGLGATTPALLLFLSMPDEIRDKALQALESFLVRRMVCRASTRDYPRLTLDLVRELQKDLDSADRTVAGFLKRQTSESTEWPDDATVSHALETLPLYRMLTRGRLRLVLEGIEEGIRKSSLAEQTASPRGLTIEHVMPQSWRANWRLPDCYLDEEEKEAASNDRNRLVHTIGNLTLVTKRLNPTLSNGPWEHKRKELERHSVMLLNSRLLDESRDAEWNEAFIQARSKGMAKLFAEVWPGPDSSVWNLA